MTYIYEVKSTTDKAVRAHVFHRVPGPTRIAGNSMVYKDVTMWLPKKALEVGKHSVIKDLDKALDALAHRRDYEADVILNVDVRVKFWFEPQVEKAIKGEDNDAK